MRFDGMIPLSTTVAFDKYAVEEQRHAAVLYMYVMQDLMRSARQSMDGHGVSIGKPQLYGCLELAPRCVEFVDCTI